MTYAAWRLPVHRRRICSALFFRGNTAGLERALNKNEEYWRENLKLVGLCLAIWFFVSFGCGILFVKTLNQVRIGGYQLGFWFAQQGSIYTFVALIFFYAARMACLDRKYGVDEG